MATKQVKLTVWKNEAGLFLTKEKALAAVARKPKRKPRR